MGIDYTKKYISLFKTDEEYNAVRDQLPFPNISYITEGTGNKFPYKENKPNIEISLPDGRIVSKDETFKIHISITGKYIYDKKIKLYVIGDNITPDNIITLTNLDFIHGKSKELDYTVRAVSEGTHSIIWKAEYKGPEYVYDTKDTYKYTYEVKSPSVSYNINNIYVTEQDTPLKFEINATGKNIKNPVVLSTTADVTPKSVTMTANDINNKSKSYSFVINDVSVAGDHVIEFTDTLNNHLNVNYTVTEKQPQPETGFKNVTRWVKGMRNIPKPDKQHWGIAEPARFNTEGAPASSERIGLEWQPDMGWYDCTKVFPEGGQESNPDNHDSNLCWAATTSNLIHWWLEQNAENIRKYAKYNGPSKYTDALHSEVYDYFKYRFTNEGAFIQNALRWFFFNKYTHESGSASPVFRPDYPKHQGFFMDVVDGEGFWNTDLYRTSTGATFNEDLKYAFENGEAIGLAIDVAGGQKGHAITIWGAHFNENEEVDKLYICENNDRFNYDGDNARRPSPMVPGQLCRNGIYEHKVKKLSNGTWALEAGAYEVYTMTVNTVVYLNNAKRQWDKYWETHNYIDPNNYDTELHYYDTGEQNVDVKKKFQFTMTTSSNKIQSPIKITHDDPNVTPKEIILTPEDNNKVNNFIFTHHGYNKPGNYSIMFSDNVNLNKFKYNIHVVDGGGLSFNNITYWVNGLTDIPNPTIEQWGVSENEKLDSQGINCPSHIGIEWKPNMGWYDCMKINPDDDPNIYSKDSNMCWAATGSNLMHWWLDRNKENIKRYGKFNGPSKYTDGFNSEIFNWSKQRFGNIAGHDTDIIVKYLYDGNGLLTGSNSGGFFKDVIRDKRDIYYSYNGDAFETELKNAINKNNAVNIVITSESTNKSHSLTLWGAHFNSQKVPDKLYIVNNDNKEHFTDPNRISPMQPGKLCKSGLTEYDIKYENSKWYIEVEHDINVNDNRRFYISKILRLSDCANQWHKYFNPPTANYIYQKEYKGVKGKPLNIQVEVELLNIIEEYQLNAETAQYMFKSNIIPAQVNKTINEIKQNNKYVFTFTPENMQSGSVIKFTDNIGNSFNIKYTYA